MALAVVLLLQRMLCGLGWGCLLRKQRLEQMALEKNPDAKILFIVALKTLATQAKARFEKYGLKAGLLQAENTELSPDDQVVIAMIQTLILVKSGIRVTTETQRLSMIFF